jgi:hypothetical protein
MSQLTDKADGFIKTHVAYAAFAVLTLTFAVILCLGVHSYDTSLAKANTAYAVLQAKVAADDAAIKSHEVVRVQQQATVNTIDAAVQTRNSSTTTLKAKLTAISNSDQQVQTDAQTYLGVVPAVEPEGFVFQKAAVQDLIATKVDDTAARQDNTDLTTQAATLKDMVSTTEADLKTCETDKAATDKVLIDYKKAATKSKWRKTLDVTEKVGLLGAGLYVGYKVAK